MRIAIYSRVSTRDKQEVENQLAELREFISKQGWQLVTEFIDRESGGTSDREQFQKMFEAASRRKFDCLIFWSLDRLSREGVRETLNHLNRLESYGVHYKSFTEQYLDSCGIFRDAVIGILATIAKQEKVRIAERTRAGLALARSRGKQLGRRAIPINSAEVVRLRANGESLRAIGKAFGISTGTVRRALRGV